MSLLEDFFPTPGQVVGVNIIEEIWGFPQASVRAKSRDSKAYIVHIHQSVQMQLLVKPLEKDIHPWRSIQTPRSMSGKISPKCWNPWRSI